MGRREAGGRAAPVRRGRGPPSHRAPFELLREVVGGSSWASAAVGVRRVRDRAAHPRRTVAIDAAGVRGVRVTPQLFTTPAELDALVRALRTLAA